jgi:hypothetical protein
MVWLASGPGLVQAAPLAAPGQDAAVDFAQKAVVRALDYKQGDRDSLMDAKEDFTTGGWNEFMKRLDGWLGENGVPLGGESFTPTGNTTVKSRANGVTFLSIPGTLQQTQNKSGTTYRVVVKVQLGGNPARIEHLEPITCGGTSTAKACK